MSNSLSVCMSEWDYILKIKSYSNNINKTIKNILIRIDMQLHPCYTETEARTCVQAFGTLGERQTCKRAGNRYGLMHTEWSTIAQVC